MLVRAGDAADEAALVQLELECFPEDPWSAKSLKAHLDNPESRTWILEIDGEPAGYALLAGSFDVLELHRIALLPGRRGNGYADQLLDAVLAYAGRTRANRLLLEVSAINEVATRWYSRRGFVEVNRRTRYYRDGSDALILRRGLAAGACGGSVRKVTP